MRSWAALVLPALASCAPSSDARPPVAPAPTASSAPPSASSGAQAPPPPSLPIGTPKLSAPTFAARAKGEPTDAKTLPRVVSAEGLDLALADAWEPAFPHTCLLASTTCQLVSVAKGAPGRRTFGAWAPAPHAWTTLFVERGRVHAQRRIDPRKVDVLDAEGAIAETRVVPAMEDLVLVELASSRFVAGSPVVDEGLGGLAVAWVKDDKPGPILPLGYQLARPRMDGEFVATARAREAGVGGRKPVWGPQRVVGLLDAKGAPTDDVAMALLVVDPPPPDWPDGKRRAGKNSCGRGKMSRPLSDPGVHKDLHVLRFSGGKLASDRVLWRNDDYDAYTTSRRGTGPVAFRALPDGGVEVDGRAYAKDDTPKGPPTAKPRRAPDPKAPAPPIVRAVQDGPAVTAIAFDEPTREGAVLWNGVLHLFDADARVTSTHAVDDDDVTCPSCAPQLAKASGAWVAALGSKLRVLTGPRAGHVTRWNDSRSHAEVTVASRLVVFRWTTSHEVMAVSFDPATATSGNEEAVGRFGRDAAVLGAVVRDGRAAAIVSLDKRLELVPIGGERTLLHQTPWPARITLQAAWGDTVAHFEPTSAGPDAPARPAVLRWLGAGVTVERPERELHDEVLATSPPTIVALGDAAPVREAACESWVPTGPRRFVAACTGGADPLVAGRGLTLRSLTF